MKMTKQYLTLLLVSAALFMYSCESVTNSVPQDEEILTQEMELTGSSKTKVDVCHYDAETDAYQLITIADPAVDAHINHGDAQPGDAVPTMEGFEFDDTCTPQVVLPQITACFTNAIELSLPNLPFDELILENFTWTEVTEEVVTEDEVYFAIGTPLNDGMLIFKIVDRYDSFFFPERDQEFLCQFTYPDPEGTTDFSSLYFNFEESFDENLKYLEYLLTL